MEEGKFRTLKIIYLAQVVGATIFALIAAYMGIRANQTGVVPTDSQISTVQSLFMILIIFSAVEYIVAGFMFKRLLNGQNSPTKLPLANRITNAFIIRVGIFQTTSLFGIVVYLLAGIYGILEGKPIYNLALLPYAALLGLVIKTYPSKEKMEPYLRQTNHLPT